MSDEPKTATEAMLRENGLTGREALAMIVVRVLADKTDLSHANRYIVARSIIEALEPSIMNAAQAAVVASRLSPPLPGESNAGFIAGPVKETK